MTDKELLQQALDALISVWNMDKTTKQVESIQAIKARLAQPKKEWVTLTDEEILEEYRQSYGDDGDLTDVYFARVIEFRLKEKNT
jgi:hypothetical protein